MLAEARLRAAGFNARIERSQLILMQIISPVRCRFYLSAGERILETLP
ncbi:hypothetical protein [Mesorhizobium tianshanense]|nr:hypothetical protein [Mesorhizobium tianshanense]